MTKEELIKKYLDNESEIERLRKENSGIIRECRGLFGHKVGEIAKSTKSIMKNEGSFLRPKWVEASKEDVYGVLREIHPIIQNYNGVGELYFGYNFLAIKKDGHVSKNCVCLNKTSLVWTGEIHEDYKDK